VKFGDELLNLEGRKIAIARIVSRLTGAPLINLYVGIIFTIIFPTQTIGLILHPVTALIICILMMVILPVSPIIYEAYRGNVDLDVSTQEVRTPFFLFAILCYVMAFIVYYIFTSPLMYTLSAAYIGVTTGVMLANVRSKVSVHTAGIAGPGTALIYIYGLPALIVVVFWIIVVWSRVVLKQHNIAQSIAGIIIGIIITLAVYSFLYPI
jgi:membrane-associated phospholipid phosphatase